MQVWLCVHASVCMCACVCGTALAHACACLCACVRACDALIVCAGKIARMTLDEVVLGDGTILRPDTVLYCTGFTKIYDLFDEDVRSRLGMQPDGLHLYRHMLCPAVTNLAFIGSEVRCHWVCGVTCVARCDQV